MSNRKQSGIAEVRELFQKMPPWSLEAEQGVLGGILLDNKEIHVAMEILEEGDFYREGHRVIYRAMQELFERGEPIDILTLVEQLKREDKLERAGGVAYLASLPDLTPSSNHVGIYANIVRSKSLLRNLIGTAQEIIARAYEDPTEVHEFLDEAEGMIFELGGKKRKSGFYSFKELAKQTIDLIDKISERQGLITGTPTGFKDLDDMTAGLHAGDLIIVAGRPAMGKTALALNIARNAAVEHKIPVAFFSLEMSKDQLAVRLLCMEARINSHSIRHGYVSREDWGKLIRAANVLQDAPIFIDDSPAISVLEMKSKARRLKTESKVGLVMVDYLQLMRGKQTRDSNREQEIADISRSLKALAKELDVPVVALSQLNRAVEIRGDKMPRLADLRESGAIEQDADLIIFVHRETGAEVSAEERARAKIIIGKQRNGPTGVVDLTFLEESTRFENYVEENENYPVGDTFP